MERKNNFSETLRRDTSTLHKIAERVGFNLELFKGNVTKELYGKYILQKYHIYDALESAMEKHKSEKNISKITFPELKRKNLLLEDLKEIMGDIWEKQPILDSASAYIYRINKLAAENSVLLIAHAYNNYLADLSGGLIIKNILQKQYTFSDNELHAYTFKIEDVNKFKENYRNILNEIVTEEDIKESFIEEVKFSYIFSIAILNELVFDKASNRDHHGKKE